MDMPKEFKEMISADIQRIEEALNHNSNTNSWDLFNEMIGKYQVCIKDFYKCLIGSNSSGTCMLYVSKLKSNHEDLIYNLKMIKSKLETFQYGMNADRIPEPTSTNVNVTTNLNVKISFEQVRSQIEDMTSLTETQTKEVLEKINTLELIHNEDSNQKSKWEKAKPILKWIGENSWDLAKTLLPLLLQL